MSETKPSGKKETITLALDSRVLKQIRRDAKGNGQSINSYINTILAKYMLFYKLAEQQKSCTLSNKSFNSILEKMPENELLEDFKTNWIDVLPTIFIEQNIPITLQNVIQYGFESIGIYAGSWHSFSHHKDESGHECMIFRHNYDIKWSRILSKGIAHLLNEQFGYYTEAALFPGSIMIKIFEKRT